MALRKDPQRGQFDLFAPHISDLPLRDQRETMERPFFSLAKRKRLQPIDYESPDGSVFVSVNAVPRYGMATIWDADVLIWAASVITEMKENGVNDIPRTLQFHAYDLLKTIRRGTSGRHYEELRAGMARLQSTTIRTNIRATGRPREREAAPEKWSACCSTASATLPGSSSTVPMACANSSAGKWTSRSWPNAPGASGCASPCAPNRATRIASNRSSSISLPRP